jgi:hypothetical protein
MPSSPTADSHHPSHFRQTAVAFLGQALLWALLWIGLVRMPSPPASGLDPSWRMVLGYASGHNFQFGDQLVFTYGPLGYLLGDTNHGAHYNHFLIWLVTANACFATIIWLLGRAFTGWHKILYYVYFITLGVGYPDAVHMAAVLLLGLAQLRDSVAGRRWLVALINVALAILSLVKFTNLMLAGFAVACLMAHHAWRRRWVDLALLFLTFGGAFLAGWIVCGQNPANIPAYLFNSLDTSNGYSDGMAIYESGLTLFLGLGAGFSLAAYFLVTLWRRRDLPKALVACLIAAAAAFMNWKHGFTRADGHVFAHYVTCLLFAVCFPVILLDDGPLRRLKTVLIWLTGGFALAGAYVCSPPAVTDAPAIWNYQVKNVLNNLLLAPDLKRNAQAEYEAIRKQHNLAGMKSVVGNKTIDMLGNEQAYVLFNQLNYQPRPVFQQYLPYTANLMRLNEAFFQSPRAPDYVLMKIDTIDYRLPALDDSLSTRYLYRHYNLVMEEAGFLLWRRGEPDATKDTVTPLGEKIVGFGDSVAVPEHGDDPIWAEIEVRQSLLGKLRAFLYKAPILTIQTTDKSGFQNNYRLIRQMGPVGFLASPHFTNNDNVQQYFTGREPNRLKTLSLVMAPEQRKYFAPAIAVRFYSLRPFPRSAPAGIKPQEINLRLFNHAPASATALYPVAIIAEGDKEVVLAHAPSAIEFNVDFPAKRISGKFGLSQKSYTPPNATDGAEFILEWKGSDGRTVILFNRLLKPLTEIGDRGMQPFDVALPQGGGRLILRITPGPDNNVSFDWAYWTDVNFTP